MHDPTTDLSCSTPGLQLRLMGVPEVRLNGVPISFSRRRALALLVYLAVTGHVHTRDVLATLLSGEASESQARKRLSNALAELRQLVGDYVVTTRDTAAFNTDLPSWTDVRAFRRALATALEGEELEPLQSALDLFHEEFLSGVTVSEASGFDEWVMLQGEALRTKAVQGLQQLVTRSVRTRANAEGIMAARRLLALEPWLEEAHRHLMILLARVGQRQEALAQYECCRSILLEELGEEPAAETRALYDRLKTPHTPVTSNLPAPTSPLLGREVELNALTSRLLESECRLITVVGLGGSGKTRLALECAHRMIGTSNSAEQPFPDGVFFLSLAGIAFPLEHSDEAGSSEVQCLAGAITALLLGTLTGPPDPIEYLRSTVPSKAMLIVLDEADNVPESALTPVLCLLAVCPEVRVVVTSRRPLHAPNEQILVLQSLRVPLDADDIDCAPASHLLLVEARRAKLDFVLRDEDRPYVVELCRAVGGLPLALSFLAPWLPKLDTAQLVAEVIRSLDVLTSSDPRIVGGHHSVCSVLSQSWKALSPEQQRTIRGMSLFRGGFESAAVRGILGGSMREISQLIDMGLIVQGEHGDYTLHELVRRYVQQELRAKSHEETEIRRKHATYYANVLAVMGEQVGQSLGARQQLGRDLDNVRDAWHWIIEQRSWSLLDRMIPGLGTYVTLAGISEETADLLADTATKLRTSLQEMQGTDAKLPVLLGRILVEYGMILLQLSHDAQAERALMEAMALSQTHGSASLQPRVYYCLGVLAVLQGRYTEGEARIRTALALARKAHTHGLECDCLLLLGQLSYVLGYPGPALDQLQQASAAYRATGDNTGEIEGLLRYGMVAIEQGEGVLGQHAVEQAKRLMNENIGEPEQDTELLITSGLLYTVKGRFAEAQDVLTRALGAYRAMGRRQRLTIHPILGEGGTLLSLGKAAHAEGELTTAHRYLQQALDVFREVGSGVGEALVLVELSRTHQAAGNDARAWQVANQAAQIVEQSDHRVLRRSALLTLGDAHFALAHLTEAAAVYAQVLVLDRCLGNRWWIVESTTSLARVALAKEDPLRASALLAPILNDLLSGNLCITSDPTRPYLTTYEILHRIGDPREAAVLETGRRLIHEQIEVAPHDVPHLLSFQRIATSQRTRHAENGHRDDLQRETVTSTNGHSNM